jgi:hypothetical protein
MRHQFLIPVNDMVHEMLLKQVPPFADSVKQSLFEWTDIHFKPGIKNFFIFHFLELCIQIVIMVNLKLKVKC